MSEKNLPPIPDVTCEQGQQQCICIMFDASKKSGIRFITNPLSRRHVAYCVGQFGLCSLAWVSVALSSKYPLLSNWKAPIVAACYTGHNLLHEFERTNSSNSTDI
jgi:hypothetical protein